jgi:hypothetical protein
MISRFIIRLLILSGILLLILSLFFGFYRFHINKFKLDENIDIIISGDSHTQSSVNDSILNHSVNVSQSSEPYLYSYNIIKFLVKKNPQIKTVILGYSFNNLTESYDGVIYDEEWTKLNYPKYLPMLDAESYRLLISGNAKGILKSAPNICSTTLNVLIKPSVISSYPFLGHFYGSPHSNMNDSTIKKAIFRHYMKNSGEQEFSDIQGEYLRKIVQFCNSRQIRIILLNTPVNKRYYDKIPAKFISKYYSMANELKQQAVLFDLHDYHLADSCFGDGDHLNIFGAEILSKKLDSLMTEKFD